MVITPGYKEAFVWRGKSSDDNEYSHALNLVKPFGNHIGKTIETKEEHESDDFWGALGGKGEY